MARFKRIVAGKNGWSDWISPSMSMGQPYRLACCDCGLVHDMQFRVKELTWRGKGGRWQGDAVSGMKVQFRAKRNKRSSSMLRRAK